MRFLSLLFLLSLCSGVRAQEVPDLNTFDPDDILVAGDKLPKVLLVGTFHFEYPNFDSHKISVEDQVDVASIKKQAEVKALVEYIARFRPNKIVVERHAGSIVNKQYHKYLAGERELEKDETEQIAFRLGKRFGIDTLIIGDVDDFADALLNGKDSSIYRPLIDSLFSAGSSDVDSTITNRYWELYALEDKMEARASLLDVFRYLNGTHRTRRGHGHYLEYKSDEEVDALAIWWYSRNLRIQRKIRQSTTSPDDRIMVLFGAGHLGILRQQFESSPAYELIDFGDL